MKTKPKAITERVHNGDRMVYEAVIQTAGWGFDQGEHQGMFDTKAEATRAIKSVMPCECAECEATA
jgi:hypothetical protein